MEELELEEEERLDALEEELEPLSLEEQEALEGIKPAVREWGYYFGFTRDAPAPRDKYPYNHNHEYKKIKKGAVTEVWRRLKLGV